MKTKMITLFAGMILTMVTANAQLDINERLLKAGGSIVTAVSITDADVAAMAAQAVAKLDSANSVAPANSSYTVRLNKLFQKHINEGGLRLNFKVYLIDEVNAFASADGSVRVFKGLMDRFTDNEVLAVIGHEIGHVNNKDTKDAIKKAYLRNAARESVSSQNKALAKLNDSQLGAIGDAILEAKFSRKQESEADEYGYNFMKRHRYPVMAMYNAFNKLHLLAGGTESSKLEQMFASHPDAKERAEKVLEWAKKDGLDKVPAEPPVKKAAPAKKTTTTKKTTSSKTSTIKKRS